MLEEEADCSNAFLLPCLLCNVSQHNFSKDCLPYLKEEDGLAHGANIRTVHK